MESAPSCVPPTASVAVMSAPNSSRMRAVVSVTFPITGPKSNGLSVIDTATPPPDTTEAWVGKLLAFMLTPECPARNGLFIIGPSAAMFAAEPWLERFFDLVLLMSK